MDRSRLFIRNTASRELFDWFLVSAVSSILLVRFYLSVSGYPSVGGTKYHIAHVLWGGLFMLAALILNAAFLGRGIQRVVALTGGIGFGIFIDEIGKLITRDNNYFFRPAVGIIYAVFVGLYLTTSFLTRNRKLSNEEYQLNALRQLEEAVHQDMDLREHVIARQLLKRANQQSLLTQRLLELVDALPVSTAPTTGVYGRFRKKFAQSYVRLWKRRTSSVIVRWFFVLQTLAFVCAVIGAIYANISDVRDFFEGKIDYGHSLVIGQLVTTVISAACIAVGLAWLGKSRVRAFEWFRRATLINLLLAQFFEFSRVEFAALPGFIFNILLLTVINMAITQETRSQVR